MNRCPTCHRDGYDPDAALVAGREREAAFLAAYPRLYCPHCRKRASARYDNIDAASGQSDTVEMGCGRCGHRWIVPRTPEWEA